MKANKLIQKHGFEKAFQIAIQNKDIKTARGILAIEKRMFGFYRNSMMPTSQFPICSNPLRLDLYSHCPFACTYCFAGHTGKEVLVPASFNRIKNNMQKIFNGEALTGAEKSFATMVRMEWPIHIGGMNDPMPPIELSKRIFYDTLIELSEYDHPYIISTKSNLPLKEESYIDIFHDMKERIVFQMSLISKDNYRFLEPYAPSPDLRIKTLEEICKRDINCIVRLQPFMPQLLEEQEQLFKIYADIGVKAVTVEGLKVKRVLKANKIKLAVMRQFGIELDKELTEKRYSKSIYPLETKIAYHKRLRDIAHYYGLQYLVADNNLRFMGDSPNCCGTDLIGAKTNSYNITHLSYKNPNDFGFHLIKNVDNDYMRLPVSYAKFKPRKRDIYQTLKHIYNSRDWMYQTYDFLYEDDDGNKHWKIKECI